ncbi:MAG: nucleotide-binding universal stress UspA family protein [Desulforhopalus sp.]|jgi:nucleotide-binding universal stress UspA family protein
MDQWKNFLIAIDEMESALKAVRYVGRLTRSMDSTSICLLHIYPEPPPHFFVNGGKLEDFQAERIARAEQIFQHGLEILSEYGIKRDTIYCTTHMAEGRTISDTLLEVRRKGNFGTVVTGKRGVSKAEEFLFGSISNTLARHCNDFAIWIVG